MKKSIAVLLIALFAIVLAVSCGEVENTLEKAQSKAVGNVLFFDEGIRSASYSGTTGKLNWSSLDYGWFFSTADSQGATNTGKPVTNIAIEKQGDSGSEVLAPAATVLADFFVGDTWDFTVKGYSKEDLDNGVVKPGSDNKNLFVGTVEDKRISENTTVNITVTLTDYGKLFFADCEGYFGFQKLSYDTKLGTSLNNVDGRVIVKFSDTTEDSEKVEYAVFEGKFVNGVLYTATEAGKASDQVAGFTTTLEGSKPGTDCIPKYYNEAINPTKDIVGTEKTLRDSTCPTTGTTQEHPIGLDASADSKIVEILVQKKNGSDSWEALVWGGGDDTEATNTFAKLDNNVFIYHNLTTTIGLTLSGNGNLDLKKVESLIFNIDLKVTEPATEPEP